MLASDKGRKTLQKSIELGTDLTCEVRNFLLQHCQEFFKTENFTFARKIRETSLKYRPGKSELAFLAARRAGHHRSLAGPGPAAVGHRACAVEPRINT